MRLRYSVSKIEQGWSPQCDGKPAEIGEWGVLKVGCVNNGLYSENDNKALPSSVDPLTEYEVAQGDILVSRANTRELLGSAALVDRTRGRMIFSDKIYRIHTRDNIEKRYLIYVLQSTPSRFQYERDATGTSGSMQNIGQDTIKDLIHPLPPLDTQRRIARFLDEKTARIDGLIEKKRALLDRLAEKRQALITRAVTKGLNPAAPMKPSGIDWLGDIPAHWEKGNIRRFARMKTGHTPSRSNPKYWEDCTIPWFTLADVWQLRDGTRWYLEETAEKISELGLAHSAAELLPAGTVAFSRTASVGYSGIMPQPMATSQDFWNWTCGPKLTPEYLLFLFRSMTQKFEESTSGSTHKTIYQGIAAGLEICVAPVEEQEAITSFVFELAAGIDVAAQQVRSSIEQLSEYRSALITAAVTGQIPELR